MKTVGDRLPDRAAAWLDAIDERLSHLDKRQREEIVDGLRLHLLEAIDSGEEADDVLVRLGSPDHVAALSPRDDEFAAHSDYWNAKRVIQIIALALTAAAVSAITLLPSYVSVTTDSAGNESITTQTVLEVGGIGFVAILAIPLIFAAAPLFARGELVADLLDRLNCSTRGLRNRRIAQHWLLFPTRCRARGDRCIPASTPSSPLLAAGSTGG